MNLNEVTEENWQEYWDSLTPEQKAKMEIIANAIDANTRTEAERHELILMMGLYMALPEEGRKELEAYAHLKAIEEINSRRPKKAKKNDRR